MRNLRKNKLISFRLSEDLVEKIDKFSKKLELVYIPMNEKKGFRSVAIRLVVEDTILRFFGPKDNEDEIMSPYYEQMSKIIPIIKNIKQREKLETMREAMREDIGLDEQKKMIKTIIGSIDRDYKIIRDD